MKRPTRRSECPKERPCPWVSCRYNLSMEFNQCAGPSRRLAIIDPWWEPGAVPRQPRNCLWDHIDGERLSFDQIGQALGYTRQRIDLVEKEALESLKRRVTTGKLAGFDFDRQRDPDPGYWEELIEEDAL